MVEASEISAALANRIENLASCLIGTQPTIKRRNEWRFRSHGSLAVVVAGTDRGAFYDHEAGTGGDALYFVRHLRGGSWSEALAWAKSWLGGDTPQPQPSPQTPGERNNARKDSGMWREVWDEGQAAARSLVETYLESRGLDLQAEAPLRFHPACPRGRDRMPAMLALMTDPITNEPCGLHRTFLKSDGSGKANVEPAKMMLGNTGVIRLSPDEDVTTGLGLTEGIETGLAIIQQAGWRPIWAAASAGAISRFPVLPGIESLTVFADADDCGAGMKAAATCAGRWTAEGREVLIQRPPDGTDWHDALGRLA
jgi:hypothetical protein